MGNAEYMGTHPIFESDFDCLTECLTERPFSLEVLATERETETSRTSLTSTEKSLRSDCEIDMDLLTLTTDETPRTQSRILMEAPSAVNEFDWSLLTDPAARRSSSRDRGRGDRGRGDDRRGSNRPHRTRYTLEVENLSSRVSWADLKDMMRKAGEVTYTDAHQRMGKNRGEVCFANSDDLHAAYKKFDGEDVNGRRLRLKITEDGSQSRSRSRSRSRGRKSRSRSARRSRSPRRSRSRSARRSRSRSGGRDRRRSKSDSRERGRDNRRGGSRSRSRSR